MTTSTKQRGVTVADLVAELLTLEQSDKVAYAYFTYKGRAKRKEGGE